MDADILGLIYKEEFCGAGYWGEVQSQGGQGDDTEAIYNNCFG